MVNVEVVLPWVNSPTWLQQVHQKLDHAVHAAYGWTAAMTPEETLGALIALNTARPAAGAPLVAI